MTTDLVLQIEDEEADVYLLKLVFQRAGIPNPLQAVTDGQMAIDYLSGAGPFADRERYALPCLVLLDVKLPKVDGLEVLAWIRQQPQLKKLAVVLYSSSSNPADIERAYELGVNSYIQKPPDLEHMLEIAQLLKGWWLTYNRFAALAEATPRPPVSPA